MKYLFSFVLAGLVAGGCTSSNGRNQVTGTTGGKPDLSFPENSNDMALQPLPTDDGGINTTDDAGLMTHDPVTCDEAAMAKSYIGCDYWPTVVANVVWSIFDFAVVVSNPGANDATVTVTGGALAAMQQVTVAAGQIQKIYLPWVPELKGGESDECGAPTTFVNSVAKAKGAYHLVSTVPVLVYQFNALEYAPQGGPAGKDWSTCKGTTTACVDPLDGIDGPIGCFSYSNDASLLMPSTAMTGNYRVTGFHGEAGGGGGGFKGLGAYFAITATVDNTTVKVQVSATGSIQASLPGASPSPSPIPAVAAGGTLTMVLNQGDVIELVGKGSNSDDPSGSLVQADQPVQVIAGHPCIDNPNGIEACDHLEQSVLPAETLGTQYAVTRPTSPTGKTPGHTVRFYGNVDGTHLTYTPAVAGAPATLMAGQVVEVSSVTVDFVVSGDHEFAVASIQWGGEKVDPTGGNGDPSLSLMAATAQYRTKYVFLAPTDYPISYADVAAPTGTNLMLDGAAVSTTPVAISGTNYVVYRIKLTAGMSGGHTLSSDQPVGLQVIGYGQSTSYQYPGGLDLKVIAQPPPPIS